MLFGRINREDPERVFVIVQNSYATAALSPDQWVAWDHITDQDGVAVTKPGGELRGSLAGVAVDTIGVGDYGLVQVWGYRSGARCAGGSGLATSKISAGTVLVCATSGFAVQAMHDLSSAATVYPYHLFPGGVGIAPKNTAAYVTRATTWVGIVFIKCL